MSSETTERESFKSFIKTTPIWFFVWMGAAVTLSLGLLFLSSGVYKTTTPDPEWSAYDRNVEYRDHIEGVILLEFSLSESSEDLDRPIVPEFAKYVSDYAIILERENRDMTVLVEAASTLRDLQPLRQYILDRRTTIK